MDTFLNLKSIFTLVVGVQLSVSGVAVKTTPDSLPAAFINSPTRVSMSLSSNYDNGSGQGNDGPGTSQGTGTR